MTLLMVAALGIGMWRWLGMTRRAGASTAPLLVGVSAMHGGHLAGSIRYSSRVRRLPRTLMRMAAASALLASAGALGILSVQSQTVVPPAQTIAPSGSTADAEFYLRRGEEWSGVGEYDRAIADYDTAILLKPDYAEAYNDRGFAYYLRGDLERAIADYTRAIALRPNYPKAFNSRGVAYMTGGYGRAQAVADFDRAIALKPDFRYAYINRANARLLRHPSLALDDFHRAGMHPERVVAGLGGAILFVVFGIAVLRRTRIRRTSG